MKWLAELEQLAELPQKLKQQSTCGYQMGRGSLLKIIHVAVEDTADELSELNVTDEAIDELDELMVDAEVNNQLRGGSSSSLRTWNQNIIDNQLGECVAEICWKT
jgi:hypothetical protein